MCTHTFIRGLKFYAKQIVFISQIFQPPHFENLQKLTSLWKLALSILTRWFLSVGIFFEHLQCILEMKTTVTSYSVLSDFIWQHSSSVISWAIEQGSPGLAAILQDWWDSCVVWDAAVVGNVEKETQTKHHSSESVTSEVLKTRTHLWELTQNYHKPCGITNKNLVLRLWKIT